MKRFLLFFAVILTGLPVTVRAQSNQVQIRIIRPSQFQNFGGRISDLGEIGSMLHATLQQMSGTRAGIRVNLLATLSSMDQSIQITARTNTSIQLTGTIPYNLLGPELTNFFDPNSVEAVGISRDDLLSGGLVPDGLYRMCVVAYDADMGDGYTVQLSNPDVSGCITLKTQYAEPPRLISIGGLPVIPAQDVFVNTELAAFPIVWAPSAVPGGIVSYKLEIADMGSPEQNAQVNELDPTLAFSNSPFVYYEQGGIPVTTLTIGPASLARKWNPGTATP